VRGRAALGETRTLGDEWGNTGECVRARGGAVGHVSVLSAPRRRRHQTTEEKSARSLWWKNQEQQEPSKAQARMYPRGGEGHAGVLRRRPAPDAPPPPPGQLPCQQWGYLLHGCTRRLRTSIAADHHPPSTAYSKLSVGCLSDNANRLGCMAARSLSDEANRLSDAWRPGTTGTCFTIASSNQGRNTVFVKRYLWSLSY